MVDACVSKGIFERIANLQLPIRPSLIPPEGLVRNPSMTLCIGHFETRKEITVIDCIREVKPPFSPEAVVIEFAAVLKSYGLNSCVGDKSAKGWCSELFGKHGITYLDTAAAKSASSRRSHWRPSTAADATCSTIPS